ncbi:MAG: polysaccharide biosynthesis protein, partial [Chitinivibrionales bacterium]
MGYSSYPEYFYKTLPINIAVFIFFSAVFNLFQGIWRYVSIDDLKDIVKTSAISSLVFMFIIVFSGQFRGYPRSIYILNFTFFVILNGGMRFTIRLFRESFVPMSNQAKNVLIVRAGAAGNEVLKSIKSAKRKTYVPVGFIDRNKSKHGKTIQGVKVLGDLSNIKNLIAKHRVREVFIAIPEATNRTVKNIMEAAKIPEWEVKFKITPSMMDIMSAKYKIDQIREVSINDLLSRPNIKLSESNVKKELAGKTVLVTGAGGSIGFEISFQVAAYKPARLILLDSSEENAYNIDCAIRSKHPEAAVHTVVGSILDKAVLEKLLKRYNVDHIYHAAAYKHVHLMEWSPVSCIKNNVLGTSVLASAAEKRGVKKFVMISTDKAVSPKGVMGLSKRLAERVVLERQQSGTKFNVVRFGNVLGSSGSVIPLFQKQIREGGPITVTHPEITRYFMSIPEAVQLVLQASTLEEVNAIFMLDMGEPVKISDLAKNLIELSGLKPGEDIEIKYSGLRPGEKLYEESLGRDENLIDTPYRKLKVQRNINRDPDRIET